DAEGDGHAGTAGQALQHVQVPQDHGVLGHDGTRRIKVRERFENPAGEAVPALGGLVRVDGGADGHRFAVPALAGELPAQHLHGVDLDEDLLLEVLAWPKLQVLVVAPRVAVDARMHTSPVRVHGPAKGHVRGVDAVEKRLALHLDQPQASHGNLTPAGALRTGERVERTCHRMYVRYA